MDASIAGPLAGLQQAVRRYPISTAIGTLLLLLVVPHILPVGLVGIERAALEGLLKLEEVLRPALWTGAKWVSTVFMQTLLACSTYGTSCKHRLYTACVDRWLWRRWLSA